MATPSNRLKPKKNSWGVNRAKKNLFVETASSNLAKSATLGVCVIKTNIKIYANKKAYRIKKIPIVTTNVVTTLVTMESSIRTKIAIVKMENANSNPASIKKFKNLDVSIRAKCPNVAMASFKPNSAKNATMVRQMAIMPHARSTAS